MLKGMMIAVVLVVMMNSAASASFETGNDLFKDITSNDGTFSIGVAYGYVMGVIDSSNGISYSIPGDVSVKDIVDTVRKYLNNNPAMRHNKADFLVNAAMDAAYPLKKQ